MDNKLSLAACLLINNPPIQCNSPHAGSTSLVFFLSASKKNMEGTILITGANGGLGTAIVSQIVQSAEYASLHGIYTVRSSSSANVIKAVFKANTIQEQQHQVLELDLSRLADVRRFAADINARIANGKLPPIRALTLNAGFQEHSTKTTSSDGIDMTFQVNYLSHFLLAVLLLQSIDKEKRRILVIGNWLHE